MRGLSSEGCSWGASKKCVLSMFGSSKEEASCLPLGQEERVKDNRVVQALNKGQDTEQPEVADAQLVARVQAGDRAAYQILVERYQSRAYALVFQILKHEQDAEDVVQEAFVKAYLSINSFQGQASFFTWFYRILVNMAIDFRRKIGRMTKDTTSLDIEARDVLEQKIGANLAATSDNPLEVTLRREQANKINQVLAAISPDHRAVIILRELEGLRYEQIADVLGVSKGTVMSRLHYARKKLQQLLGEALNYRGAVSSKIVSSK